MGGIYHFQTVMRWPRFTKQAERWDSRNLGSVSHWATDLCE